MSPISIRTMQPPDLDFAAACTAAEGWTTETRQEFEAFHAHDPGGCFVAEADGMRIGICVATPYGVHGSIGELIVIPEMRGRGAGRHLLEHAIGYLHRQGARTVFLDGVVTAVPLYERIGFRKVCRSLRFSGTIQGRRHPDVRPMRTADLDAAAELDRIAFGADRRFILERRLSRCPELCKVLQRGDRVAGFIVGRRHGDLVSAGPWIVRQEIAHPVDLLEGLAAEAGESTICLGILETNSKAVAMLGTLGFSERTEPPWRMVLGPVDHLGDSAMVYAIGSPAQG